MPLQEQVVVLHNLIKKFFPWPSKLMSRIFDFIRTCMANCGSADERFFHFRIKVITVDKETKKFTLEQADLMGYVDEMSMTAHRYILRRPYSLKAEVSGNKKSLTISMPQVTKVEKVKNWWKTLFKKEVKHNKKVEIFVSRLDLDNGKNHDDDDESTVVGSLLIKHSDDEYDSEEDDGSTDEVSSTNGTVMSIDDRLPSTYGYPSTNAMVEHWLKTNDAYQGLPHYKVT